MRLGLFGGTFNPIHLGHLRAGVEIQERFSLDRVLYLPAALPPHKTASELLPFAHRLKMVRLAVKGRSRLKASDAEMKRPGKSYSIQTVRYFHRIFPRGVELFFSFSAWTPSWRFPPGRSIPAYSGFAISSSWIGKGFPAGVWLNSFCGRFPRSSSLIPGSIDFSIPAAIRSDWASITRLDISSHLYPGIAAAGEKHRLPRSGSRGGIHLGKKALWKLKESGGAYSRPKKKPG